MRANLKKLLIVSSLANYVYVLPYPGIMPGNKVYRVKQVVEWAQQYWAFGSLSRHKYELGLADKKLVEAKTLFEYQQYPLAITALADSNEHIRLAYKYLAQAGKEGKDITLRQDIFNQAIEKHLEVLNQMLVSLPEKYFWQPEKDIGNSLKIHELITTAIKIREI